MSFFKKQQCLKKMGLCFLIDKKKLSGDPYHIALGLAIGVFVAINPTMPFHTIFVLALAILLRASKPDALIGVWASNPFTMVFLYLACFKTGCFFPGTLHTHWYQLNY